MEHYQLPAAGEDVPDSFHEWAERVGLEFTSEQDGTMIYLVRPPRKGWRVAHPGDVLVKYDDGAFNHFQVPEGFALVPVETPLENIAHEVFGDADSNWNTTREKLENEMLMAASALMKHTRAGGTEQSGYGVTIKVGTYAQQ